MIIVSDTSPITNLIRINQLDLLKALFKEVIIPKKVFEELSDYEKQHSEIVKQDWIIVKQVIDSDAVFQLKEKLDPGEAEAIILAQELNADFLIIDERKGRKIAEDHGLKIIGLLGVLIQAKRNGHITELRPILDTLIDDIGFRVSKNLYSKILRTVGE